MIVILDYGMGNPGSIQNMIKKLGCHSIISMERKEIMNATAIILPGVGSFDNGITKLNSSGTLDIIRGKVIDDKLPFLGICLGMQLLFEKSEEGSLSGLGWIPGEVKRFIFNSDSQRLRIPHMGWDEINLVRPNVLLNNLEDPSRFYFVHSYYVICYNSENVLATTNYGHEFASVINKDNIWGTQFHPEKSHKFGLHLLRNFININCGKR